MAAEESWLTQLDVFTSKLLSDWNVYTSIFAVLLLAFVAYPLLTGQDPDTHAFLLARQATTSPVRESGETAVYRSIEIPYSYPLRAGLGVKDPGTPKWSSGRNGDLRDIWRQAVRGPVKDDGTSAGEKGKVITVLGREKVEKHGLEDMASEINVIGNYIQDANGKRAAVCLSNSAELLSSIFAAAFHNFRAILVPHNRPTDLLAEHLVQCKPDLLIAEAGAVQIEEVIAKCPSLRSVIWVAHGGNRHMDWNVVPEGTGSKVEVAVWHELVEERRAMVNSDVLPFDKEQSPVQPLSAFCETEEDQVGPLVEYTSENLIAGTSALRSALPRNRVLNPSDLLLSTVSLTSSSYALCLTFAALYANASIAMNSVAGDGVDLSLAALGVSPTVLVTSTTTISAYYDKILGTQKGLVSQLGRYVQNQSLQAGTMPPANSLLKLAQVDSRLSLSKLRLLFIACPANSSSTARLPSSTLADLRMLLGARIGYALTSPSVAGAVCQTNVHDYRESAGSASFGAPLSSLEVKLVGDEGQVSLAQPVGKIVVSGPSVCNGTADLGVEGRIGGDNTLSLV